MFPSAKQIGFPFIELHTVDSTNNYAMGLVHAGMAQHGTCVFAHEQTKGKGQRSKRWVSIHGQNILLSIIIEPFNLRPEQLFRLSMMTAIGVQRFYSHYVGEDTYIKWPNDIYWRDRKAGGILIENNLQGREWKYAVIGIGLNINQTSFEGMPVKAVSLRQITGRRYDTVEMAKSLINTLQTTFEELLNNSEEIASCYHKFLYKNHQTVRLRKGSRIFDAYIKGVTEDGRLVTATSMEEYFSVGEVEWVMHEE
ncbi:biotin--[acetyl-CoA-carboxylase] ligase [Chitinophagaceae bacterium LB-8]|uniref:Biotin--[acetyl-CoA-carboxylase] ligase n=1 Tax=Paraflavisolibacter caeni TaxID=2982496 RepID=A0A9X3B8Q3_9BACT|nr:biotin--[acetyl-CoA-carboxylase] ligase [Paraflavisolibacter caeni]MCU7551075.1 biotin--[acetyl-CoA-carboxylase] ligase [Paraflavisolibacter caeni]